MCAAVDPYSINGAIITAKSKKKNLYVLNNLINRSGLLNITDSIHKIAGRIRICFKDANIIAEAVDQLIKLFSEPLDFDALIFINVQIQNFPNFCEAISHCTSLSILSFTSCSLTDDKIELLIPSLRNLKHLQTFDISHDNVGPVMFNNLCHALCMNHELESFHWKDNQLGDPSSFVDLVKSVPNLSQVDFRGIILSESWIKALCQLLDESWQLTSIKITDNNDILRKKIEKNEMRRELLRRGPAARMIRYAIPDSNDLFDEF
ncbi:hypothetical protein M9Y10_021851 [Tritrichomonas musculus]|uniref:Leucine Rich Repeat family protein n=1 Tax=Tritrichomonas musculus TaxID=1915356 RepID=A0ABR2KRJ1_9EUKA